MKNKLSFLLLFLLCTFQYMSAQTSEGFRYQAIARNPNTGAAIAGSALNLQFLIRANTSTSPAIYIETHNVTTNNVGLFSVEIGKGSVLTGNFSSINWGSVTHFLETQIGGVSIGTEQLIYVPYSKYADKAGSVDLIAGNGIAVMGGTITNLLPDQIVTVLGTGATTVSGTYPNFTLFSTDSQQLHFSNDTLYLANGGSIYLGGYLDNTDSQSISLTNNHLAITGSLSMIDLSAYLDNTDGQTLSYDPATGIIAISNGNSIAIPIPDGSETKINAGSNISVTGDGTIGNPYIISVLINNNISSSINTITSSINGNSSSTSIINSISNDVTNGVLTTSVNGVASSVLLPIADGSETHINGSSNVNVTGIGTLNTPYYISLNTKDITTSTTGMMVTNGINQVVGTTNMTVDYHLATGIGALASGVQGVLGGTGSANTYVGADGQQHLLPNAPAATTNTLTSNGNDITSTVDGVASTTTTINSVSNTSISNTVTTIVNGVTSAGVPIINSNTLSSIGNTMTNETNGVISSSSIINTHTNALNKASGLVNTVNGVAATTAIPAGTVADIIGFDGSGVAVNQPVSVLLTGSTTVSNTITANDLTTTVNGVTGAAVPIVNSISNTSVGNNLSTTVNGVVSPPVSIINSNALSLVGDSLTASVNGVTGIGVNLSPYLDNTDNQYLSISAGYLGISGGNSVVVDSLSYWKKNTSDIYYNVGNVGIGTNSPSHRLHLAGLDDALRIEGTQGSTLYGGKINFGDGNYAYIQEEYDNSLKIQSDYLTLSNYGTTINASTTINGYASVYGSAYVSGNLTVNNSSTVYSNSTVYGTAYNYNNMVVKSSIWGYAPNWNYAYNLGYNTSNGGYFATRGATNGYVNNIISSPASNANRGYMAVCDALGNIQAGMYVTSNNTLGVYGYLFADVKAFVDDHPTDATKSIFYACVEGPEAAAYTRGTTKLQNGKAIVHLPEHFEWVSSEKSITVIITPLSASSKGLAVIKKSNKGFEVQELFNGNGDYEFDWEIKAVRKGHENFEVIRDKSEYAPAQMTDNPVKAPNIKE